MSKAISRRNLLKAAGIAGGAALGTRLGGTSWLGNAMAANEKSALVVIFHQGGFNQMFCATDCVLGRMGVNAGEVENVGNGLSIHKPTFGTFSAFAKSHMATIGTTVPAGGDHDRGIRLQYFSDKGPWISRLAAAMGGDAAIKGAIMGEAFGVEKAPSVGGVAVQYISDISPLIANLGGSSAPPPPTTPDRDIAAKGILLAERMSKPTIDANPTSLTALGEGFKVAGNLVSKPRKIVDFQDIANAYGIGSQRTLNTVSKMNMQLAAAELLVRTGTNVIQVGNPNAQEVNSLYTWDSHGNQNGVPERYLMGQSIDAIRTFLSRMLEDPDYNVVVAFIGDFGRTHGNPDAQGTGHAGILSAPVFGKYVKTGTTGRTRQITTPPYEEEFIEPSRGGIETMWSYFAEVLKSSNPFGANPHGLVL